MQNKLLHTLVVKFFKIQIGTKLLLSKIIYVEALVSIFLVKVAKASLLQDKLLQTLMGFIKVQL